MKELHRKYPNIIKRAPADAELFERYALCELETWSDRSLELYYRDICSAQINSKNLAEERYNSMYRRTGQESLVELEAKFVD
ncbi:MAG: hypothetical protein K0Q77_1588 [Anaerosporomusa subterranea]|nr:hypothetical protein [Anaerosporomusa subterranea]